jgi:hypothetical protein
MSSLLQDRSLSMPARFFYCGFRDQWAASSRIRHSSAFLNLSIPQHRSGVGRVPGQNVYFIDLYKLSRQTAIARNPGELPPSNASAAIFQLTFYQFRRLIG